MEADILLSWILLQFKLRVMQKLLEICQLIERVVQV